MTATAEAGVTAGAAEPDSLPDTPYKGLVPFSERDAPFFFGRDDEQELVEANLLAARLTVLYAESGVGKTSVLRAGAVRHLREDARTNLARRGKAKVVPVIFSSWRDDPIGGLKEAVREGVEAVFGDRAPELEAPDGSLVDSLEAWAGRVDAELLVILDQFEEYFMYHPDEDASGGFGVELARAVNHPGLRANFLLSLREDALAKLDRFKGELPSLLENYLRLEHLDRDAARDAIEKPIAKYNSLLRDPSASEVSIEPELVEAVLDQVRAGRLSFDEAGRGTAVEAHESLVEAPFLQLVMTRLWNEEKREWGGDGPRVLRAATLERLGGADRIAKTHLDSVMDAELTGDQRAAAANFFHYLVTPSGGKIAHRASDLALYVRLPAADVEPILKKLADQEVRVLRTVAPPPGADRESRYEIFHDILAGAILDWRARQAKRQSRRAVGLWVIAFALGLVCVGLPLGMPLVAWHMRRVKPAFRWREVVYVLLAMAGGWTLGVIFGFFVGTALPVGDEDSAIGFAYWLFAAILAPLAGFLTYSKYNRAVDRG